MNLEDLYFNTIVIFGVLFLYLLYLAWLQDEAEIVKIREQVAQSHNIDSAAKKLIEKANKKSLYNKMVNSCYTGLIRGGAIGLISGQKTGTFAGAIAFGVINPIIVYIQHNHLPDETLSHIQKYSLI